jgi:hypothetical protein
MVSLICGRYSIMGDKQLGYSPLVNSSRMSIRAVSFVDSILWIIFSLFQLPSGDISGKFHR